MLELLLRECVGVQHALRQFLAVRRGRVTNRVREVRPGHGPGRVSALLGDVAFDSDGPVLTRLGELFAGDIADDLDDAGMGHYVNHASGCAGRENLAIFTVGDKGGNVDAGDLLPEVPRLAENGREIGVITDGQFTVFGPGQIVGDEGGWIPERLEGILEIGEGGVVGAPGEWLGGCGGAGLWGFRDRCP